MIPDKKLMLFIGISLGLAIIGCKSPVEQLEPLPDTGVSWQLHPEVTLDRRLQIQAQVAGDSLWLLGNNYLLCLDADHRVVVDVLVAPLGNQLWYRSFLSPRYFATELKGQHRFDLRHNHDPDLATQVDLRAMDSSVQEINLGYNSPMAINDRGQLLVAGWVNAAASPDVTGAPLFLLQTELDGDSLMVSLEETQWVNRQVINFANRNRVNGIYAFGDTFYFSMTNPYSLYRMVPGEKPEVLFPMTLAHMFRVHDTLMAVGYDSDYNLSWYFSPPGQQAWQGFNFGRFDNGFMRYEAVEDRVICYLRTQIWELTPEPDFSQLNIQELNNEGLDQLIIHDLAVFQNRVYLCTTRGLYYLPLADFFTPKPTE